MPSFTIETTYHLPVYRHQTYEADTVEQACQLAIEDDDWSNEKSDYDSAGETYVSGVWHGVDAAYHGVPAPIPSHFHESVQRKAEHFETLLGILKILAHARDSQASDFPFWLARAEAAIAKAEPSSPARLIPAETEALRAGADSPRHPAGAPARGPCRHHEPSRIAHRLIFRRGMPGLDAAARRSTGKPFP